MPQVVHRIDAGGVASLVLARAERHNAFARHTIDELTAALDTLAGNCRLLLLAAEGPSFCAGADIDWMRASVALTPGENRADAMALSDMLEKLNQFPAPTIARVHGAAFGGGVGLVACCDMAIAAEGARFALSEVRIGLIPATISPYVIAAIGARQARRYFLSAERFDAWEARRIGLVHEVVGRAELDGRIAALTEALCAGGPAAQRAARHLVFDVANRPVDTPLREMLADRLADTRAAAEAQEGLGAFLDKRTPDWSGGSSTR